MSVHSLLTDFQRTTQSITITKQWQQPLAALIETVGQVLSADHARLLTVRPALRGEKYLEEAHGWHRTEPNTIQLGEMHELMSDAVVYSLKFGGTLFVARTSDERDPYLAFWGSTPHHMLLIPMLVQSNLWGIIRIDFDRPVQAPSAYALAQIRAGTVQMGRAIARFEEEQAASTLRTMIVTVNELAADAAKPVNERIADILEYARTALNMDIGLISEISGNSYRVRFATPATAGIAPETLFELGHTYCMTTFERSTTLAIAHAEVSEFMAHPCHELFKLEAYIGNALTVNDVRFGTVNFSSPTPRPEFTQEQQTFIRAVSERVSTLLQEVVPA